MNINNIEEVITGMTSSDLDLLAKMAKEELERREKNKRQELWKKVCEALHAYQQYDNVHINIHEGPNSYYITLEEDGFDLNTPGDLDAG